MNVKLLIPLLLAGFVIACAEDKEPVQPAETSPAGPAPAAPTSVASTCSGTYPSYWQDPKFPEMYAGQEVSNQAPAGYTGRVFELSDTYPTSYVDEAADQPWRSNKFDAMFDTRTDDASKTALAEEYIWEVLKYIQAGNINSGNTDTDWNVCNNEIRSWYNIPYQTYNVLAGREFTHGLTREAPVGFSMNTSDEALRGTMWAIGFFNPTAAYTLGQVWQKDGTPRIPTENVSFEEGAVVGKPLFTTLNATGMPMLANLPAWQANISDPGFCGCTPTDGNQCTMAEESQQCPRSLGNWGPVTLLQFDVLVKDSRAPSTQWVFGTFVADGERKAAESNPWNRISPLGLMWGNSTPPEGELASGYPDNPGENGFDDIVIFWDTVDMLNENGGSNTFAHPGHLGCNSRLDGPADKAYSACMSCHATASVADSSIKVPAIAAQFGGATSECALEDPGDASKWIDASGATASQKPPSGKEEPLITYPEIDSIYFATTPAASSFNTIVSTAGGYENIYAAPVYDPPQSDWISLDYSLQLSISIVQWQQWQQHVNAATPAEKRIHSAKLPRR